MVTGADYNNIVYFGEVPVGRHFASSQTGRNYIKTTSISWVRDPHCDRPGDYAERFDDRTLVYLGANLERALY